MSRENGLDIDLYLRKSRKDIEEEKKSASTGEDYDTLQRHRRQLLAVAKKENHNIMKVHEEIVSGESISERPQIQELIRRIEAGLIEGVLVVDLDRLGRGDMLDQGILDRAFRYSGTLLLTPTEVFDPTDESWELVFGVKSLVARQELKSITRRLQNGRIDSASEGKSITKKPPYGYLRDESLRLYPNPDTAWVVQKIFRMMKEGQGRIHIANELDKLGVSPPTPKKEQWSPSSITAIIKNEAYLGHIIWGKIKHIKRGGKYHKQKVPREKWHMKENAHEPLVSKELFEEANQAHTGRWRPSTTQSRSLSNPLAGILKCGYCGYSMLYVPRPNRPNNTIRCAQPSCRGKQKSAALALVEDRLIQILEQYTREFNIASENKKHDKTIVLLKEKAREKRQSELQDLTTQKNNLHDLLERGVYDIDTFLARQQNISERMKQIEQEIQQLDSEIQKETMRNKNIVEYIPKVRKILQAYQDTNDVERKNQLLKSILEKVTYIRKKEWTKKDQFELQIYSKI
jgi:site-specific DNA recombinase